jgi:hypothetical protein
MADKKVALIFNAKGILFSEIFVQPKMRELEHFQHKANKDDMTCSDHVSTKIILLFSLALDET